MYFPLSLMRTEPWLTLHDPNWNKHDENFKELAKKVDAPYYHPSEKMLVPETDIIVPRLLRLINEIYEKIKELDPGIKYTTWRSYVAKVFGNTIFQSHLAVKFAELYFASIFF